MRGYLRTERFVFAICLRAEPRYPDADAISCFLVRQLAQPIRKWSTTIGCHVRDDLSRSYLGHST